VSDDVNTTACVARSDSQWTYSHAPWHVSPAAVSNESHIQGTTTDVAVLVHSANCHMIVLPTVVLCPWLIRKTVAGPRYTTSCSKDPWTLQSYSFIYREHSSRHTLETQCSSWTGGHADQITPSTPHRLEPSTLKRIYSPTRRSYPAHDARDACTLLLLTRVGQVACLDRLTDGRTFYIGYVYIPQSAPSPA
jgi:hypothetical protein